jgi:isoleucyl-tRNA synthetase
MNDVILEELNIKEMIVLTDDAGIVQKSAKPNFKAIGPKHGKKANPVANAIRALSGELIEVLEKGSSITVQVDGVDVEIAKEDVEIIRSEIQGWIVQNEEGITVALDTELTPDLVAEGIAREFVNRVQNLRKDSGFDVTDRIEIKYNAPEDLAAAVKQFEQYIANETLAATFRTDGDFEFFVDAEIDDKIVNISIKKYQA